MKQGAEIGKTQLPTKETGTARSHLKPGKGHIFPQSLQNGITFDTLILDF